MLRTLISVGELGPAEERWPKQEEYLLADYRYDMDLLRQGRSTSVPSTTRPTLPALRCFASCRRKVTRGARHV